MELKKYNPILKRHTLHKEIKISFIMAKKVEATLSKGDVVKLTKVIQAKKLAQTGAYTFRSRIVPAEVVKEILSSS